MDESYDGVVGLSERAPVIAAVRATIDRAIQGDGESLFIFGEPGTGKTTLLGSAVTKAGAGIQVLHAKGSLAEADLPFVYIEQVFGPLTTGDPSPQGMDPLTRRAVVHSLARSRMRERAALGPLLILLDDLHWADPDSLRVVSYVVRRAGGMPVAVLGAARAWPEHAARIVRQLVSEGLAASVALEPLSREGSGEFLSAVVGEELPQGVIDSAFQLTSGIPLLLREAGHTIRAEGGLPHHGLGQPDRRHSLLLLSHVGALPPDTVRALQATAVLGTRVRLRLAQSISAMDEEDFARALDVALAARVLRDEGNGTVAFRHEMLAAAMVEDMPPALRRLLHSRAYARYVEAGELSAAVPHALRAGLHGDREAIDNVTTAASAALAEGALETGMAHLDAAFELSGPTPSIELLERRADALFLANQPESARDLYLRVLRENLPEESRSVVLAKATRCAAYAGQLAEALDSYDRLLKASPSEPMRADLFVERSRVIWELEGPGAALGSLDDVDEAQLARSSRERIEGVRDAYLFQVGDLAGVPQAERRARAVLHALAAGGSFDLQSTANTIMMHATNCAALERFDETVEMVDSGLEFFGQSGAYLPMVPLFICKLGVLLHSGALVETVAGVDDLEEEMELGPLLAPYLIAYKARALVAMGRIDDARRAQEKAMQFPGTQAWVVRLGLDMAEGQTLLILGRIQEAARVYQRIEQTVRRIDLRHPCVVIWAGEAVDVALAAGDLETAERRVDWVEANSAAAMGVWPRMIALAGRAGIAAAGGDDDQADRLFVAALEEPCPLELERARVLLRYGTWLRHHGQSVRARSPLAEALRRAEARGAAPLAEEARQELSAAGGRRRRSTTGNELTTQQARVATLAATGATNREIAGQLHISARTVESHLAAALLKLNVRTRAELRQRRRELGLGSA